MSDDTALEINNSFQNKNVVFLPDWSAANPYQNLLKASLEKHNFKVLIQDFPKQQFALTKLKRANPAVDVIHIHWVNPFIAHIFWNKNRFNQYIKLFMLLIDILIVRFQGTKLVWTIHNLVSHETPDKALEIKARKLIAMAVNSVIIHSDSAKKIVQEVYQINLEKNATVIPHGNYDGCYPFYEQCALKIKQDLKLDNNTIVLLFFGAIRPYKGVEYLLDAFKSSTIPKLRLIIAGNPLNDEYAKSIYDLAEGDDRILLLLEFISEDDVAAIFSIADVVTIPFERTLTSGSVILALTMGKALLLPEDARIFDIVNESCCIFFDSKASLVSSISQLDKAELLKMSNSSRAIANKLDWKSIAKKVAKIYQ